MKRFLLLFPALFGALAARAQIDILPRRSGVERYTTANAPLYDSLANLSERSYAALPGQTLFMNGTRGGSNGYAECFYPTDFLCDDGAAKYAVKTVSTPREAVDGKYFDVLETRVRRQGRLASWCLVLRERASGDTLYYKPATYPRAMTCVGYYEKLKRRYVGARFFALGRRVETLDGRILAPRVGASYRCEGVGMEMAADGAVLVLCDSVGERVKATPVDEAVWEFVSEERMAAAVARFGEEMGRLVALGRVVVGMTRQMADEAWGEPYRSSAHAAEEGTIEWLSYDRNRYLTLRDGVVVGVSGGD